LIWLFRNGKGASGVDVYCRTVRRKGVGRIYNQMSVIESMPVSVTSKQSTVIGAVDIGGTKIAVGLEDETGRIAGRCEVPTWPQEGFACAMDRVIELLSKATRATESKLGGIGIGCTGPVDPISGVLGSVNFFPDWEGCNPVSALSKAFGVSAVMENDADAAALGEVRRGAAKGKRSLICVTVGTGIGGGIILDGRIYRGGGGTHPEIGHHVMEASGPLCSCGARGCWETLASGPAISEWFKRNAPEGPSSSGITTEEVCARASKGDPWCLLAVDRGARYLGIGIANLINMFAPEVIVLSGSVMKSADLFLDIIRGTIRENCRLVPFETTAVQLSSLGADLGLIGAAEAWRYRSQNAEGDV
jgi:glucokinase